MGDFVNSVLKFVKTGPGGQSPHRPSNIDTHPFQRMYAIAMLARGAAKKVTIYLNEDTPHHLTSLHDAVMSLLLRKGVAGATAVRGMSGFGQHQSLHTVDNEFSAQHLPVVIEFVDSCEKVEELLPSLYDMVNDGVIEVHDTTVIKAARKSSKAEPSRPRQRQTGPAKMLQIFLGEADAFHGEPLYEAIIKRLRMEDTAGATVEKGILGYGAKGHTHKESFLHFSKDLPIVITVVDTPEKVARAIEVVEDMMGAALSDALIVTSDVETIRLVHAPVPAVAVQNPEAPDASTPAG
jgi:PII-like signaling protein